MAAPNWIDAVLDGGPNFFTGGSVTRVDVCNTEPTTYGTIVSNSLAGYVIDGADFTKAAGDTNPGRKVTMGAQTGATASAAGNGNFLAFSNGTDTYYGVIAADGDAIGNGQQVDLAAVDVYEVQAPTTEA